MIVSSVEVTGFRSIRDSIEFFPRPDLTCLIGANEHGKTNLLDAIAVLSTRKFLDDDRHSGSSLSTEPRIRFGLALSGPETRKLLARLEKQRSAAEAALSTAKSANPPNDAAVRKQTARVGYYAAALGLFGKQGRRSVNFTVNSDSSMRIDFGSFYIDVAANADPAESLANALPQVRLFSPSAELADTITLDELNNRRNLPFEGLLKLADAWAKRNVLFGADLAAQRLLVRSSRRLTRRMRKIWTQGALHTFQLSESAGKLRVTIEDPMTLDSPSRRSLGFRSFLSLALSIYAETATFTPRGFVLLLDEPGLHLHPQGQKDLLGELRKLARDNQVVYTTHSPFLIDRNDPTAVFLVRKELRGKKRGTHVIRKPSGNNWGAVVAALGITPADGFFPPDVALLVEGTSDRLYVSHYMTRYAGRTHADLNYLCIFDADRRSEMAGVARLFVAAECRLVIMIDGDPGGTAWAKNLRKLLGKHADLTEVLDIGQITKQRPCTLEDLLPPSTWAKAAWTYAKEVLRKEPAEADLGHLGEIGRAPERVRRAKELFVARHWLEDRDDFSRVTVADLFCRHDADAPVECELMLQLCGDLTSALAIRS